MSPPNLFGPAVTQVIDEHRQRVLLGWLDDQTAQAMLATPGVIDLVDRTSLLDVCRSEVASRPDSVDQSGVLVGQPPAEVVDHVEVLRRGGTAAAYFREGWTVQMVDLRQIISLQPSVALDGAITRTDSFTSADLGALAALTLPAGPPEVVPISCDPRGVWTLSSPNPNLRVLQPACGPMETLGGATVVGYVVGILPSFLQVAVVEDRFVLRDGYHRSVGLLAHGITMVPAFVRRYSNVEGLGGPGLFSASVFMGSRPPVLADFLDAKVTTTPAPALHSNRRTCSSNSNIYRRLIASLESVESGIRDRRTGLSADRPTASSLDRRRPSHQSNFRTPAVSKLAAHANGWLQVDGTASCGVFGDECAPVLFVDGRRWHG